MSANPSQDISSNYDLVLVFPWTEDDSLKEKPKVLDFIRRIEESGKFETFKYLSVQNDEVFAHFNIVYKLTSADVPCNRYTY